MTWEELELLHRLLGRYYTHTSNIITATNVASVMRSVAQSRGAILRKVRGEAND